MKYQVFLYHFFVISFSLTVSVMSPLLGNQHNHLPGLVAGRDIVCMTCPDQTLCTHTACTQPNCAICSACDTRLRLNDCTTCSPCQDPDTCSVISPPCTPCILPEINTHDSPNCLSSNIPKRTLASGMPRTIFIPRSQGANAARQIVGWEEFFHKPTPCSQLLVTAHTLSYTQSFRSNRIANYLFGTNSLSFAGSQIPSRSRCQFLADSLGLCPNFTGCLRIEPAIQNIIFDNQFFFSLNGICPGLYISLDLPIVHTRWTLHACPTQTTESCIPFRPCTVGPAEVIGSHEILQAMSGNFLFGAMQTPFKADRLTNQTQTLTKLAHIQLLLGYDLWQHPDYFFGFFAECIAPTGNRPENTFLFEPIVGNGHHWELGGGLIGNLLIARYGPAQQLLLYIDAHITHMFQDDQCRTFDFCTHGPLSRYHLLQQFNQAHEFTGQLINGVNFTLHPVTVSRAVKADIVFKLAYYDPCITFDIGYNFYGHTHEDLCLKPCSRKYAYTFKAANICQTPSPQAHHFLTTRDLLLESGTSPATATHKLFTHLNFYPPNFSKHTFQPYIGFGGELEVNALACNEQNNSLNQWGIWIKGGFAF